ncbi:MAG: hypothetical protein JSU63_01585 [Phycisphaerales bacterium]|nr:MAG: hypothetical protein JSU63_01585 [Phycisphaerales bacterium]
MTLEDFHAIRALREREAHLFQDIQPADDPKKIILYSVDPWQLGVVEQFLHVAFELWGHRPKTLYYDGLLPLTAWESHNVSPPKPGTLHERAQHICGAFGISPIGISTYLDADCARGQAAVLVHSLSDEDLETLTYRRIPIGSLALRDLFQYTVGYFEPHSIEYLRLYRDHLIHAIMSVDLAYAIIEKEEPDIIVLVNGKSVMYTYMYEVARLLGLQVTTWEEGMYWDTSIVLANDARAIDFPVSDEDWGAFRAVPLDDDQRHAIEDYFDRWRRQEATYYTFYDNEVCDFAPIRRELAIPDGTRLISLFANIISDTNALEKDRALHGMMDWLYSTVDFARHRDDLTLLNRACPCENKWLCRTHTPIKALIMERFAGELPKNVRIVDGASEFSSYEIARHSDCRAVYTSTLGVELSMMGLEPLICGIPFYSGRGFVNDIHSREEYFAILAGDRSPDGVDLDRLKQFMYLVVFNLVKKPEFHGGIHTNPQCPRVSIDTFAGFPESMPVFNAIVDAILTNTSFIRVKEMV